MKDQSYDVNIAVNRRSFLGVGLGLAATSVVAQQRAVGQSAGEPTVRSQFSEPVGRRLLGKLEVSAVGTGVQNMAHMIENSGAIGVRFTPSEITELNSSVRAVEIRGQRLPDSVLVFSAVEAPPKN